MINLVNLFFVALFFYSYNDYFDTIVGNDIKYLKKTVFGYFNVKSNESDSSQCLPINDFNKVTIIKDKNYFRKCILKNIDGDINPFMMAERI